MQEHKKKFQAEYMSSDIKPKGKILRWIQKSFRQKNKKAIDKEVKENSV